MDAILQSLSDSIGVWGYGILFLYSLGGGFVALLAAGILASAESLNIFICIFVAGIANFIGSCALFYLSRYQKSEVMKMFQKHRRKIALAHIWIKKFGVWIIFIHKYLYGIKTIIPIVVGFSKYSGKRFIAHNALASFAWAIIIGGVAYIMGDLIRQIYERYSNPYIFPALAVCIILAFVFLANKITKKLK